MHTTERGRTLCSIPLSRERAEERRVGHSIRTRRCHRGCSRAVSGIYSHACFLSHVERWARSRYSFPIQRPHHSSCCACAHVGQAFVNTSTKKETPELRGRGKSSFSASLTRPNMTIQKRILSPCVPIFARCTVTIKASKRHASAN